MKLRRRSPSAARPLPPGPPPDASLYDCDGFPLSFDETFGTRRWDLAPEPRPARRQFIDSEGVPIDRERFEELREQWRKRGWTTVYDSDGFLVDEHSPV
jgi:hypothetical protein